MIQDAWSALGYFRDREQRDEKPWRHLIGCGKNIAVDLKQML